MRNFSQIVAYAMLSVAFLQLYEIPLASCGYSGLRLYPTGFHKSARL